MKVIAVDFDGTLCERAWPGIGDAKVPVIRELLEEQANGAKIILWTCREGEKLDAAVEWCRERGIVFDAVNDNLPENVEHFGSNSRKVSATEYWDDRAALVFGSDGNVGIAAPWEDGAMYLFQCTRGEELISVDFVRLKRKRWWQFWRSV